jgi:hypothetical protein
MSEDRAAQAALAIERYVDGLRAELSVLEPAESAELTREISTMLIDAARRDPERAFAEMERLGEPWHLAASLLAERGISADGGIPTASWWRMGIAATVDILIALAFPAAVMISVYKSAWQSIAGPYAGEVGSYQTVMSFVLVAALLGLSLTLSWRMWAPWRTGGPTATPGMALARISVVRLGGTRTVVQDSDLAAAGLATPKRSLLSAAVSVGISLLIVSWSLGLVADGALDPSGQGMVARLAGTLDEQKTTVEESVAGLYDAAMTPDSDSRNWPEMSRDGFDDGFRAELMQRMGQNSDSGAGYSIGGAVNSAPGVWTVRVTEDGKDGARRDATLLYTLRIDWNISGFPEPAWVLMHYEPLP